MKRLTVSAIVCGVVLLTLSVGLARAFEEPRPFIQIAVLLDTSNSMDGLIDQAKSQLWKIVNEFATAKKRGRIPELQVALYEYGNNGLPAREGYIRLVVPLTTDLDKVSEKLFALTTDGGSEYCGQVIDVAARALDWSESNNDLKAIFIAGNEAFTQGNVDYRKACQAAVTRGIVVNTIFCGPYDVGVNIKWKDGAMLADGTYMNIDQDRIVVHIVAPQDAEITRLGVQLNVTYVPYGRLGIEGFERQAMQDTNAAGKAKAGTYVQRAVAKASVQYRNEGWDLVDAAAKGSVKLEELKADDLPEEMKNMTADEKKAYLAKKLQERQAIQKTISKLNEERKQYVAEEMKKLSEKGEDTFDAAIIKALRKQAEQKNFQLK